VCEGRSAHFEGGVRLVVSCGHAYLTTVSQRKAPAPRFVREPRGVRCEELGLRLAIDPERLPPFECRTFRPGDRIGGRKLKEVFLTARIPAPERRLLPLI